MRSGILWWCRRFPVNSCLKSLRVPWTIQREMVGIPIIIGGVQVPIIVLYCPQLVVILQIRLISIDDELWVLTVHNIVNLSVWVGLYAVSWR